MSGSSVQLPPVPIGNLFAPSPYRVERVSSTVLVVHVSGEIDLATENDFRRFVTAHVPSGRNLVIDLSEVAFFGASGLRVLTEIAHRFAFDGLHFVIVPGRPVARLLHAAGMSDTFSRAVSVEDGVSVLAVLARADLSVG